MNGYEQRAAGTRFAQLSKEIADLQLVVDALGRVMAQEREVWREQLKLAATRTNQLSKADAQLRDDIAMLVHDDLEHERVIVRLRPLADTTLLQRLSWLFTGRT